MQGLLALYFEWVWQVQSSTYERRKKVIVRKVGYSIIHFSIPLRRFALVFGVTLLVGLAKRYHERLIRDQDEIFFLEAGLMPLLFSSILFHRRFNRAIIDFVLNNQYRFDQFISLALVGQYGM